MERDDRYASRPNGIAWRRAGCVLLVCIAALAQGCASFGGGDAAGGGQAAQLKLDSALANANGEQPQPLLAGLLRLNAPGRLLSYKADYAVKPGAALLQSAANDTNPAISSAPPAGESFGQRIDARLPFFDAPVLLNVQDRYQGVLTQPGFGLSAARTADLSWTPHSLRFGLGWNAASEIPAAFDCGLRGSVSLPASLIASSAGQHLELSGRECKVVAPDRGLSGQDVDAWSAAWQWQGGAGKSAVHFTVLDFQNPLVLGELPHAPAYEIGASRTQVRGRLSAKSSVAARRVIDPQSGRELTRWSARTTLSRQYSSVAVSASLQHGADPLWFLPNQAGGDQFDLGLNFKRWIESYLSLKYLDMALSWSLTRPALASDPLITRVFWNFSLSR